MYQRSFFLLLFAALLAGCTDFHTPLTKPTANLIPPAYRFYTEKQNTLVPWWKQFHNKELEELIQEGLRHNFSLQQTWARLIQAQSIARKAGADSFPYINAAAGGAHNRAGKEDGTETNTDDFSFGLSIGYEADLWGRVKATKNIATLDAQAKNEDVYAAAMSLSAEIAIAWLDLLSARQQAEQLTTQLNLNKRLLELIELRFATSKASALDVYQQNQTVTGIEGALILIEGKEQTALHRLAVLIGRPPTATLNTTQTIFPQIPTLPPGGLPADLLSQRPDIRSQGLQLQGATWSIAAAKADRLPQLNLTGELTYNSSIIESLLDAWLLRLAASFTAPLMDGGARSAEVQRTRAVAEERLAAYRESVILALKEVEDALVFEHQHRKSIANIDQQITLSKMAYREATWRYLNGLSDYLPVIREQINLITAEQDRITTERDLIQTRVTLHKALGGTWTDKLVPDEAMSLSTAQ